VQESIKIGIYLKLNSFVLYKCCFYHQYRKDNFICDRVYCGSSLYLNFNDEANKTQLLFSDI